MARFLREYAGTNWIGWLIIMAILSLPFLWKKAVDQSVVWHQMLNVVLAFFVGSQFSGTAHRMTGNDAIGTAVFYGFGVGYSILALRKRSTFERVAGGSCLLFSASLTVMTAVHQWKQM